MKTLRFLSFIIIILIAGLTISYSCDNNETDYEEEPVNDEDPENDDEDEDDEDEAFEDEASYITDFISNINSDSIKSTVEWLEQMGSRYAMNDNRKELALKIVKKLVNYGYTNASIDSFYKDVDFTWQYNVIATLEGSTYPDSICIVGGHYDSISNQNPKVTAPGANDNAGGVAAVLEIARIMKKKSFKPKTSIRFIAFAAEEIEKCGSYNYAKKARDNGMKIKMMLNEDMIAYEPSVNPDDWVVNIMNYDNSKELLSLATNLCAKYTCLKSINDNECNDDSDSYSFYRMGFISLFFICVSEDPNYHTINDLSSNCNFKYCSEIVKLTCSILMHNNTNETYVSVN